MNKYIAFYKGKKIVVEAPTSLQARDAAAEIFKAKKAYDVTVMLSELEGKPYIHSTASI